MRVPTLAQFLAVLAPSGKEALVELKGSWNREQLLGVADQIYGYGLEGRVILVSFSLTTLQYLREVANDVPRAIITKEVVGDPAVLAGSCGAVAIVTSRGFLEEDPGAVDRMHAAGLGRARLHAQRGGRLGDGPRPGRRRVHHRRDRGTR